MTLSGLQGATAMVLTRHQAYHTSDQQSWYKGFKSFCQWLVLFEYAMYKYSKTEVDMLNHDFYAFQMKNLDIFFLSFLICVLYLVVSHGSPAPMVRINLPQL